MCPVVLGCGLFLSAEGHGLRLQPGIQEGPGRIPREVDAYYIPSQRRLIKEALPMWDEA